ncbi:helix-turn-helix domain-containing protein [Streptomyces sp. NPDC057552]
MPHSSPDIPDMSDLLRQWRGRRRIADIPEGAAGNPDGPVTQTLMAQLLEVSPRHYQRLESGERPMSSDTIARISCLLGLHTDEARALYRWSGRPVPPLLTPAAPEIPHELLDWMDSLPCGALWEGPDFGILAYNARAARNWPWVRRPGANIMLDLLLEGPGRRQCAEWEERWAPLLLAQLRQGSLAEGNTALRAIVDQVCEDPRVRELWNSTADLRSHSYGTTRPMYLPGWEPRPAWITIMGWQPLHAPGLRLVTGTAARGSREPDLPDGVQGGGPARGGGHAGAG